MSVDKIFSNPRKYRKWYENHYRIYENEKKVVGSFNLKDCLDIGSGPDIFHEVIKGYIVSLDLSLLMLKESKSEDKVLADATYLPFRDKAFKCVFSSVTVCFIEDIKSFISEIGRVTKGRAVICFIPRDSPWGQHYESLGKKGHEYYSYAHFISKQELYRIISEFMNVKNISSTLIELDEEKIEPVYNDDRGSFVCIEAYAR